MQRTLKAEFKILFGIYLYFKYRYIHAYMIEITAPVTENRQLKRLLDMIKHSQ